MPEQVNVRRDIHGPMLQCKYCGLWMLVTKEIVENEENGVPYKCYVCREKEEPTHE